MAAFNAPTDAEVENNLLRMYTPHTRFTIDGREMDWTGFLAYVAAIRAAVARVEVTSHHFLRDGAKFADMHTVVGYPKEGGPESRFEVMVVGEVDGEGKCVWIVEMARAVPPAAKPE